MARVKRCAYARQCRFERLCSDFAFVNARYSWVDDGNSLAHQPPCSLVDREANRMILGSRVIRACGGESGTRCRAEPDVVPGGDPTPVTISGSGNAFTIAQTGIVNPNGGGGSWACIIDFYDNFGDSVQVELGLNTY